MPVRLRALVLVTSLVAAAFTTVAPTATSPALAAGQKVAIVVGPVGGLTSSYRLWADRVATAATAAGATVVKAYSPNATWPNVKAAVNGANVVVYFGHGSGYPNPYGSTELTDRANGWGLNTATTNQDADSWSAGTLVYCGEKALLGTLTSSDGAAQRTYCGGASNTDGITPASGFTMVYAQAHYAPGFGERYVETTPLTTLTEARERVRNYSTPILRLGGTFIATAYNDADAIVSRVLTAPTKTYGQLFSEGRGYSPSTLTDTAHPDVAGARTWVQRTTITGFHFDEPDYWYAFAGNPNATPAGGTGTFTPPPPPSPPTEPAPVFSDIAGSKFYDDILWLAEQGITSGCADDRFCPDGVVTRGQMASFLARALNLPATTRDYFVDDETNKHEGNINRLAAAGITRGCGAGRFCPDGLVARDQMASFLDRAVGFAAAPTDFFGDDEGNRHEASINDIAGADVTRGCATELYCPQGAVTRGQMAAFLHRAMGDG